MKISDSQHLLTKIESIKKENPLDLSVDEDLAVGVMNLISIEEHLFFTIEKTGHSKYLELLNDVRKLRIEAFKRLVENPDGEGWCIGKHLLAASMRFMEVGTKNLKNGRKEDAKAFFDQGFALFSMFWQVRSGDEKIPSRESRFKVLENSPKQSDLATAVSWVKEKLNCCRE
ncbi:MAG: hypothetical protein UW69_C0086G0010 [Microgenomates group bacterium GW2011_GWA2_44_7]|nr:MAG: hypothetical protein UW69_C0086G0010 [Microgenomates group bacterium GW2011_GWA2_44_7]KKT78447.1 MAG: hypothetical protein UW73_C0003G0095 [Microgenomates group bacterium GW2011_GWB1_44_8]